MRILLFLLLFSGAVEAQPLSSAAIDTLVERTLRTFDVPGIAVCVIKDGKVVHSRGYGVRSLATRQRVDENTLFGIASNSKAFTTAALGMLVDEGKIRWDDKVRMYIPEFKLFDPYVTEEFTIRDLLCHRSGLGLGAGDLMFFPDSSDFTIRDILHNLQFLKPVTSFRSSYAYDNNLYIVAGEIVARVSGMSWEDFIEQRIMGPLGMGHSAASWDRLKDTTDWIDAHARVEGTVRVIARSRSKVDHAAGGIYSSIADLSKWVLCHLQGGKYGPDMKPLFSAAVLRERWAPQTILPLGGPGPYNTHFAAYGLGFGLSDVKGYKQVSHTGGLEGMVTQITMVPELQLGIIVLTNQEEGLAFNAITNQIKDGYLGMTGTDRVKEYAAVRRRQLEEEKKVVDSIYKGINFASGAAVTEASVAAYVGTYRDAWFGDVVISMKGGRLWFDSRRSPKLTGELAPYRGNTFIAKWRDRSMNADAFVLFDLNERGIGRVITMKPVSPLTDFSYDFQDLELKRQ
ncbi:MAG TPA: serine hydrolase [Puia sp.]|uniref:serine hydrolase n=1 Tax=Puia sp. TaxID=2045100 RepID=UPI002C4A7A14|nr:serine hydrolase [Puia sp.]HVU95972.1 serine hydrolase [Puia sp.]